MANFIRTFGVRILLRAAAIISPATPDLPTSRSLEPIYQQLFRRDLTKLGEEDIYYPIGAAANYSFLYLILRVAVELRPRSVLDIGAGQTSLLWGRLHARGDVAQVLTVEDNPEWAEIVKAKIDHKLILSPLRAQTVAGVTVNTYDWEQVRALGPFDVITCDGPVGTPDHSRYGLLNLVDESLPNDFAIILDDAERKGEQDTVAAIQRQLEYYGKSYAFGEVNAFKRQVIFAGGQYRRAAYF